MHTTLYGTINAPLYVYENGEKKLNITDYAIKEFQKKYKDKATAENIFAYCHAVLSSPKYQKEYEENLKIDYPRIPLYKNFDRFVELGKRLIKLQTEFENFDCHAVARNDGEENSARNDGSGVLSKQESHCEINQTSHYEANAEVIQKIDCHADNNNNVALAHCVNNSKKSAQGVSTPCYSATEKINLKIEKDFKYMPEDFSMIKLNKEKGIIIFDGKNRIENIPKKAFDYKIATKSAIEWVINYFSNKNLRPDKEPDHKTLIENGLNSYDYKNIREYLFELIPKVINISVETVDIFKELEKLN